MSIGLVWILIGTMVGAILQRSAGLGLALILAPVCVAVIGPISGVMLVKAIAVVSSSIIIPSVWKDIQWRKIIPLLLAAIPGAVLGALIVTTVTTAWLEIVIGIGLILGLIATLVVPPTREPQERPVLRTALGITAGTVSTTAGSGGPVILIYASAAGWPFRVLAATVQPYYLGIAIIALLTKIVAQPDMFPQLTLLQWVSIIGCLLGSIIGGNIVSPKIPQSAARILALSIATLGAVVTLFSGLTGLL